VASSSAPLLDATGFEIRDGDTVQFDTPEARLWGVAIVDAENVVPAGLLLVELDPDQAEGGVVRIPATECVLIGGAS
jgi:hypothetical protein